MLSENEPQSTRILTGPVLILVVLFVAFLLMTMCALVFLLLNLQKESSPTFQQDIPAFILPTEALLNTMPTDDFSIHLPVILTGVRPGPASVSAQIWIVAKIKFLGYELDGQRYDQATFTRIDGQDRAKGYCINRGWATPEIGTEYLLTTEGIFVPLQEPQADPLQRFLKIQ